MKYQRGGGDDGDVAGELDDVPPGADGGLRHGHWALRVLDELDLVGLQLEDVPDECDGESEREADSEEHEEGVLYADFEVVVDGAVSVGRLGVRVLETFAFDEAVDLEERVVFVFLQQSAFVFAVFRVVRVVFLQLLRRLCLLLQDLRLFSFCLVRRDAL